MIQKKALLVKSASRSLIPFAIGSTSYLLKELSLQVSQQNSTVNLLNQIIEVSFGVYKNYFGFLLVMLLIDLISRLTQKARKTPSLDLEEGVKKELGSFNEMLKSLISSIISYSLIFIACYMIAAAIFTSPIVAVKSSTVPQFAEFSQIGAPRVLEQVPTVASSASESPLSGEKISLSMGNILSSLNVDVNAMVLTKDKKIAFATVAYYGTLKIIDLSNENYPTVISSLALKQTGPVFKVKSLALSSDEKTLYVSNMRDFEIINITNLEAPKKISFTNSSIFDDISFLQMGRSFRTSLVIDESTKTAFVGGLGLQIFDISDPRKPVILKELRNEIGSNNEVQRLELCLSQVKDKRVLFIANNTLDGYDVSNPKEIKQLYSFQVYSSARSLLLSNDSKTLYLLGNTSENEIIMSTIDISDSQSPVVLSHSDTGIFTQLSFGFLAVSPLRTKFFIYTDERRGYELYIYDIKKGVIIKNKNTPIENVFALAFTQNGKTLITASNDQFVMFGLVTDYPNSQILQSSASLVSTFELSSAYQKMQITPDGKILFVLRSVTRAMAPRLYSILDIYNMTDKSAPAMLSSYQCDQSYFQMTFSNDYNKMYLLARQVVLVLDVSDRRMPRTLGVSVLKNSELVFSQLSVSSDGETGFLAMREDSSGDTNITLFNFTSSHYIEGFYTINSTFAASNMKMALSADNKALFVIDKQINIYNLSNLTSPVLLSNLSLGVDEIAPFISSCLLSPNNMTLFIETCDDNQFTNLRIYDIANLKSPELLSELALPKFDSQRPRPAFSLNPDLQSGFVFQEDNSLLKINLTDLSGPFVSGMIALSEDKTETIQNYILSPDGQSAISVTGKSLLKVLDLTTRYTLYLKQENFLLGKKSSETLSILRLRSDSSDYQRLDKNSYKIIKLSLLDIKIAPNQFITESTSAPLPSWISFNKQTNRLDVEPKSTADIGSYTFQSAISLKISIDALRNFGGQDVIMWLISLGYVDTELFLTSNFGSFETFLLPTQYANYRTHIYSILEQHYIETCTSFQVLPSLALHFSVRDHAFMISTPSTGELNVDIKLYPLSANSQVRFLSKSYDLVLTAFFDSKSRIVLEGDLADINAALRSIIVDLDNVNVYDAYITISDGLNPLLTSYVLYANNYFLANSAPTLSTHHSGSIQEQIDPVPISSGQSFSIHFDKKTFVDLNSNDLTYHLEMADSNATVPSWLVLEGLKLHGTAPEDLTGRDLEMLLVAKNEFKYISAPFTLHVNLATKTVFQWVLKCGFILMMIVLAIITIRSWTKKEEEKPGRDSQENLLRRNNGEAYEVY